MILSINFAILTFLRFLSNFLIILGSIGMKIFFFFFLEGNKQGRHKKKIGRVSGNKGMFFFQFRPDGNACVVIVRHLLGFASIRLDFSYHTIVNKSWSCCYLLFCSSCCRATTARCVTTACWETSTASVATCLAASAMAELEMYRTKEDGVYYTILATLATPPGANVQYSHWNR